MQIPLSLIVAASAVALVVGSCICSCIGCQRQPMSMSVLPAAVAVGMFSCGFAPAVRCGPPSCSSLSKGVLVSHSVVIRFCPLQFQPSPSPVTHDPFNFIDAHCVEAYMSSVGFKKVMWQVQNLQHQEPPQTQPPKSQIKCLNPQNSLCCSLPGGYRLN